MSSDCKGATKLCISAAVPLRAGPAVAAAAPAAGLRWARRDSPAFALSRAALVRARAGACWELGGDASPRFLRLPAPAVGAECGVAGEAAAAAWLEDPGLWKDPSAPWPACAEAELAAGVCLGRLRPADSIEAPAATSRALRAALASATASSMDLLLFF